MEPTAVLDACSLSQRCLLTALASLTDEDFRSRSLLPGYSRGHVIAHLANKTRSHVWLFGGPAAREIRHQHPDGYDPDLAADTGARRPAAELRSDLEESFAQLQAAWGELDDHCWDEQGVVQPGLRTMAEIVARHLRDVEVHHVDLDIGYQPASWPAIFVEGELAKRLRDLPGRAPHADLLAWLIGRAPAPRLSAW